MASSQCQVQVSINSGAWQSGGINGVAFGATVALRNIVSSASSYVWALPDYPPALPAMPTGWQQVNGVWTCYQATPPAFTLPASGPNAWGKLPIWLSINGNAPQFTPAGQPNPQFNAAWFDTATILSLPSPTMQMPGFCFAESSQFDSLRSWAGAIMANLRAMDAFAATISGYAAWTNLTHATTGTTISVSQIQVTLNTSAGACLAIFPANPTDGLRIRFRDPPATYGPPAGCNWGTTPGQVQGNATGSQYVEDPASPGTFHAAGVAVSLPKFNGATQDYTWHALSSAWLLS
jgi:hypothetical protein